MSFIKTPMFAWLCNIYKSESLFKANSNKFRSVIFQLATDVLHDCRETTLAWTLIDIPDAATCSDPSTKNISKLTHNCKYWTNRGYTRLFVFCFFVVLFFLQKKTFSVRNYFHLDFYVPMQLKSSFLLQNATSKIQQILSVNNTF